VNHDPSNMGDMCDRLLCRLDESGANGYFAAGPALEGTACRNASGQNNDYFCIQVTPDISKKYLSKPNQVLF
jgi:hypothetical protein